MAAMTSAEAPAAAASAFFASILSAALFFLAQRLLDSSMRSLRSSAFFGRLASASHRVRRGWMESGMPCLS